MCMFSLPNDISHLFATYINLRSTKRSTNHRGNGAEGRDRTGDLAITNRSLYQLSYFGYVSFVIHVSIFCNAARASASGTIV
jgi:hypothetical protein